MNSLMYVMTIIRFNLKFALLIFSRYCFNLNSIHVKAITQLLRYVKRILHFNIHYEGKENLMNYIDANWVDVVDDRRSIKEYIYFLFDDFISWSLKR